MGNGIGWVILATLCCLLPFADTAEGKEPVVCDIRIGEETSLGESVKSLSPKSFMVLQVKLHQHLKLKAAYEIILRHKKLSKKESSRLKSMSHLGMNFGDGCEILIVDTVKIGIGYEPIKSLFTGEGEPIIIFEQEGYRGNAATASDWDSLNLLTKGMSDKSFLLPAEK